MIDKRVFFRLNNNWDQTSKKPKLHMELTSFNIFFTKCFLYQGNSFKNKRKSFYLLIWFGSSSDKINCMNTHNLISNMTYTSLLLSRTMVVVWYNHFAKKLNLRNCNVFFINYKHLVHLFTYVCTYCLNFEIIVTRYFVQVVACIYLEYVLKRLK